jgi:Trypsin
VRGATVSAAADGMPRRRRFAALVGLALSLSSPPVAHAVILGTSSSLDGHTVQLVDSAGRVKCSGAVIDRSIVVTAAHCAGLRTIIAGGHRVAVAAAAHGTVVTETGLRVSAGGDAAFLRLRSPLPGSVGPIGIGPGGGGSLTIAGFGAVDEIHQGGGALHEASLVHAGRFLLVDPRRSGPISASACFGDSGGPVVSGGQLVGVITRASYPRSPRACGYYTHYAPVVVSGQPATTGSGGAARASRATQNQAGR